MPTIDFDVINNVIHRRSGFSPVLGEKNYTKLRFFFRGGYGWDNCTVATASFAISADKPVYSEPSLIENVDLTTRFAVFRIPSAFSEYRGRIYVAVQGSYSAGTDVVTIASNIVAVDIQNGILIEAGVEQSLYEKIAALVQQSSVVQYGAKGDGVTDDTEAIYKAIVRNDVVYFPPGTYRTAGIIITNSEHPTVTEKVTNGQTEYTFVRPQNKPKTLVGAGRKSVIKPISADGYGYFCKKCGHIHRGGTLPDEDYLCPECRSDRTYLVKITNDAVIRIGRKFNADEKPDPFKDNTKYDFDLVHECTISDLTIEADIDGTEENRHKLGLSLYATYRSTIHNVLVQRALYHGVDLASNAHDCHLSNVKVRYCCMFGIRHSGYGNSLSNLDISQNQMDGVNISVGGCQFANVKTWANRAAGMRIRGAKYCMIANVNSQQNRGSGLVIEGNAAYNVITGFESVGNNYSGSFSEDKVEYNKWAPNLTFEDGSGYVVGGHDNTVQGSDVRAKWTKDWFGIEKSALYIPFDAQNNRVELLCTDGDKALTDIYNDSTLIGNTGKNHFGNLGFEKSVMLAKFNSNNHVRINGSQIDFVAIGTTWTALEYRQNALSDLDQLSTKAQVTKEGNTFCVTGIAGNEKAVNEIAPRALKNSCSSSSSDKITGSFYIGGTIYGYPLKVYYNVPVNVTVDQLKDKFLGIKITAKIKGKDTWVVVPVLFLKRDDTVKYLDNLFSITESRSIVSSNNPNDDSITREFVYYLSEKKLSEEKPSEADWSECQLILALLKTAAAESTDDTPHTVTLDISELSCAVSDVTTVTGTEFDETHYTKAEIDAAIQAAIGGVENGAY